MSPQYRTQLKRRKALTRVEVIVILFVILLLVIMFIAMFPEMKRLRMENASVCAGNLKGIGTALYTYGNENNQYWPIAPHAPAIEEGKGLVTYAPGKIATHRGNIADPLAGQTTEQDTEMSTTRNLWILIKSNIATPNYFICPDSYDIPNNDNNPELLWDFLSWHEISYGYQVPYGKQGQPNSDRDQRMPLMADKGPFSGSLEVNEPNPGPPTAGLNSERKHWRPWNSPNHSGAGQNILYADGHANWSWTPIAGIENDNIYTRWSDANGGINSDGKIRGHGTVPTSNETPFSNTDTLIYP